MYEGLLYGDPKMRILRILWTTIYNDHNARIKEEQNHGKHYVFAPLASLQWVDRNTIHANATTPTRSVRRT